MWQTEFFFISDHFLPFYSPSPSPIKESKFWKNEKNHRDIIILHKCTINDNHMTYGSWDINCNRYIFFVVLGHFLPFCHFLPFFAQKMKTSRKWRKHPRDIIILHKCTKTHNHMLYCSWDLVHDGCNCYFSFWTIFCPFTSATAWKMKISKKMKKILEISSFYKSVQKTMIICYTALEIWRVTDVIVFHFRQFFALLPH